VTTIMLGAALLDQIARVVTGEKTRNVPQSRIATIVPSSAPTASRATTGVIAVIDGDTVRSEGTTWRLVGFNAP
jgi:endonuclease YncB( thermonuclease family)